MLLPLMLRLPLKRVFPGMRFDNYDDQDCSTLELLYTGLSYIIHCCIYTECLTFRLQYLSRVSTHDCFVVSFE